MRPSDSDNSSDNDWTDPGGLTWNEFDWEIYLREQAEPLHRYLGFYEKLKSHPDRIDEVARLMRWDENETDDDDSAEPTGADAPASADDLVPYTLHKNPVFIATAALFLSLSRNWQCLAADAGKVPQPLALAYLASLHRGEQQAVLAIQMLDLGDYTIAISLFKRALRELNTTLALIDDRAASRHRALAAFREDAQVKLFDLREIWLRVIGECRDEVSRHTKDVEDDES